MRRATTRWGAWPAALAVLVLAGCGDRTGPDPLPHYDPRDSLERLDQVLDRLDASEQLFLGLALATSELFDQTASASFVAAMAPLATRAPGPGPTVRRALPSTGARVLADVGPLITFPVGFRGETLVWDPGEGYVVDPDATGAPADGIRVTWYRMSATSGFPSSPLEVKGYIDMVGAARSTSDRIEILAVDQTGSTDRVAADYYVDAVATGTASSGTFRWSAVGGVGLGSAQLALDVVQHFAWSQAQDREELFAEYRYTVPAGAVHLEIEGLTGFEASDWTHIWFLGRFDPGLALAADMDVYIAPDDALDGVFRKSGAEVIRVTGHDGSPRFEWTDGRGVSGTERTALGRIWDGTGDLSILTEWVVYPGWLLLAFGE